ncbi:hypothetical protein EGN24_12910 [Enterococcus faecalis]|nr:hypothetical protein [Enterococcus faecalis]
MKKELAVVSVWALLQATPFINWRTNLETAKDKNPQVLPARIISQTNYVKIVKANQQKESKDKKNKLLLESFESMINDLEEQPQVRGKTNTTQLGLTMMSMAGTILISDDHK